MDEDELEGRFVFKKFAGSLAGISDRLRDEALMFAHTVNNAMPDGREKSLAINAIEEALMWSNKGVARRAQ